MWMYWGGFKATRGIISLGIFERIYMPEKVIPLGSWYVEVAQSTGLSLRVIGMNGFATFLQESVIWISCSGSDHKTLHVIGMQMFVAVPQGLVIWICCSGPKHRSLHVIGMKRFVCLPQRVVIWMCCSGPEHRSLHVHGMQITSRSARCAEVGQSILVTMLV
jgi:hypothetical protein